MSMTESLRKLLRKMGGSPSNGDNSDELVDKIADAYTPGGGGVLVVNIVEEGSGVRFDHTMGEILDAMPLVYIEGKGETYMAYTNSPLVTYTNLTQSHSGLRNHSIDRITPHSNNERRFDVINSYYHEDGHKYTIPYKGHAFTAQSLTDYPATSGK